MIDVKRKTHRAFLWIVALLVTAGSVFYQRRTGPSYPLRGSAWIGSEEVAFALPRSETVGRDAVVSVTVADTAVMGRLTYRRYRSDDDWTEQAMDRTGDKLAAALPRQPAAGKMMYFVHLTIAGERISLSEETPAMLRYKGAVPAGILILHIFIMFLAILFSTRAGLETLYRRGNARQWMLWTIGWFFVGGFILGMLVQKNAFGVYWSGVPFGWDLTDNKTLIAMLGWLWAWSRNRKGMEGRLWIAFAAVLMLAVYLIPHSLFGSELDYMKMP